MVSSDNDQSLVQDAKLLKLVNSSADGIVKLKEVAKGTVVVEKMHLLIDGGTLGHEEEALVRATVVQDVNSLEGHILEAREISSITLSTMGVVLKTLGVVGVDVTVEPDGKVALAEDTESLLLGISGGEASLVVADGVALLLKLGKVVLALVRTLTSQEVLGTATKEDIGTVLLGPAVVGHSVESLVNERTVLASETSVAGQGDGGSIGEIGGGNGTPSTFLRAVRYFLLGALDFDTYHDTLEDLNNGLNLGIVKGILGSIGVHTISLLALIASCLRAKAHTP